MVAGFLSVTYNRNNASGTSNCKPWIFHLNIGLSAGEELASVLYLNISHSDGAVTSKNRNVYLSTLFFGAKKGRA